MPAIRRPATGRPVTRRGALAVPAALIGAQLTAGCRRPGSQVTTEYSLASGPLRSVYRAWSTALAEEVDDRWPEYRLSVRSTSGSVENLTRLREGSADLAVASADSVALAVAGQVPFTQRVVCSALARVFDDYLHLIVRDDGEIREVADLAGRRIALGPAGSGTSLVARRLLEALRIKVVALPLDLVDAGLALQGRRVEGLFWLGGVPTQGLWELAQRVRVRPVQLGSAATSMRLRHGGAYRAASIAASAYPWRSAVTTVAAPNLLLCRPSLPGGLARAVLSTAFEARDAIAAKAPAGTALDRRAAISTFPVALHTAAVEYYRDVKP